MRPASSRGAKVATTTSWSTSRLTPHPNRAEARDFADVFELSQHFSKEDLLADASEVDRGFDRHIFAEMLRSLARFSDADLPAPEAHMASMRDFFATWADKLDT